MRVRGSDVRYFDGWRTTIHIHTHCHDASPSGISAHRVCDVYPTSGTKNTLHCFPHAARQHASGSCWWVSTAFCSFLWCCAPQTSFISQRLHNGRPLVILKFMCMRENVYLCVQQCDPTLNCFLCTPEKRIFHFQFYLYLQTTRWALLQVLPI